MSEEKMATADDFHVDLVDLGNANDLREVLHHFCESIIDGFDEKVAKEEDPMDAVIEECVKYVGFFAEETQLATIPEHMSQAVLAARLRAKMGDRLPKDPVEDELQIVLMSLSFLAMEFIEILADCCETKAAKEVFNLRHEALLTKWVDIFIKDDLNA